MTRGTELLIIYLKSTLFGVAGAMLASVLWILATFVLPLVIPQLLSRLGGGDGVGAAGARITSDSILWAALIGFAVGFYWRFRG
jgi:hypothetical protein